MGQLKEKSLAPTIISVAKSHSCDFLSLLSSASSKGSLRLLMQLQNKGEIVLFFF